MKLKWSTNIGGVSTAINETDPIPNNAYAAQANFGIFEISVNRGRLFKDDTIQWLVFVRIPVASSREIITLTKHRGDMRSAIAAAEKCLFSQPFATSEVTS